MTFDMFTLVADSGNTYYEHTGDIGYKVKELRDELYTECIIDGVHIRPYRVWLHNSNSEDEMINISTTYPLPLEVANAWVDKVIAAKEYNTVTIHMYTSSIGQDDNGYIVIE